MKDRLIESPFENCQNDPQCARKFGTENRFRPFCVGVCVETCGSRKLAQVGKTKENGTKPIYEKKKQLSKF